MTHAMRTSAPIHLASSQMMINHSCVRQTKPIALPLAHARGPDRRDFVTGKGSLRIDSILAMANGHKITIILMTNNEVNNTVGNKILIIEFCCTKYYIIILL